MNQSDKEDWEFILESDGKRCRRIGKGKCNSLCLIYDCLPLTNKERYDKVFKLLNASRSVLAIEGEY